MVWLGPWPVLWTVVGTTVDLVVWARVHPPSFDRWAAPWLRRHWRRWTVYRGRRWTAVLIDCDLVRDNRRTGQLLVPRVLRVRSATRSIDTLYVRMARGQDLHVWTEKADALAAALFAHRVAITKVAPRGARRRRRAGDALPARRPGPGHPGRPARGRPHRASTSATTNTATPSPLGRAGQARVRRRSLRRGEGLAAVGPAARDRADDPRRTRPGVDDRSEGRGRDRAGTAAVRTATPPPWPHAIDVLTEVRDAMKARQEHLRRTRTRKLAVSVEWPLELVMIDEMAMLTAYGDRGDVREAIRLLAEILTQGRACLISVMGYVQEPTKDIVDVRELFTTRICLGVTAASHVDMVLGDGARERGALADEIPGDEAHAGIGFVIDQGSRLPIRFRAAYVSDEEIDELVTRCAAWARPGDVIDLAQRRDDTTRTTTDDGRRRRRQRGCRWGCGRDAHPTTRPHRHPGVPGRHGGHCPDLRAGRARLGRPGRRPPRHPRHARPRRPRRALVVLRLLVRFVRERIEDAADARTAAAWRAAHHHTDLRCPGELWRGCRDVGRHRMGRRYLAQNHASLLALGVAAAWLWCSPGWFAVCVVVAALVELWAIRQLAREWAWEARSSWWWSP